ncbi:NAD-dependent epimerase/dehydratase family protein [Myroides guanonis]|uniref:dTDP-D-glucose 4,6-dehydratase n=1 Tax=Myroides guanonis TaxID=1150112 RepID=A0A1I3L3H0_9FLAO|nr:NAD-dependent epimerase/dehydratase family protein [Myroides guanonis]SFI79251.1 dTDP-D-glucose 4,6-dehydratase [Myroides guanonis]
MKPIRSFQHILIIGETHFVGKTLVIQLLNQYSDIEIWVTESSVLNEVEDDLKTRIHLLKISNKKDFIDAWRVYSWDTVLHLVSKYKDNSIEYKSALHDQKSLLGGAMLEIVQSTRLEPLYVEIETDWVFEDEVSGITEDAEEVNVLFLENYTNRIGIETTNILSKDMQPSHWIFSFIKSLENKTSFGVPCDAMVLRDWIALEDYLEAICVVLAKGDVGNQYTIVGFNEWTNYDLMLLIGATYDRLEVRENGAFKFKLCNEKIGCRKSYEETKIGLSFLSLDKTFKSKSVYDIVGELIGVPLSLVTKG